MSTIPVAPNRAILATWCAMTAMAVIVSVGIALVVAARADNEKCDKDVLTTLVRGLQERDEALRELAWRGTQTTQFDKGIVRALRAQGIQISAGSHTLRIVWARRGPHMCAAFQIIEEQTFDGTKTTRDRPEGIRDDVLAAWKSVAAFDGEATLTIAVPTEGEIGVANVVPGLDVPISEFGPKVGVLRAADEVAAAVEAGGAYCQRVRLNDVDCWRVDIRRDLKGDGPTVSRVWIASQLGFAVVREERLSPEGWLMIETEREDFAQFNKHGQFVWIPSTVTQKRYWHDKRWRDQPWCTAVLSVGEVTLEVPPDHLFLGLTVDDLPRGYVVVDKRSGTNYESGVLPGEYDDKIRLLADRLNELLRDRDVDRLRREWTGEAAGGRYTGAQALLLLCAMKGIDTSTPELIELSGTTAQGTTMNGLQAAAGQKGLRCSIASVPVDEFAELKMPVIIEEARNRFIALVCITDGAAVVVAPPVRVDLVPLYRVPQLMGSRATALTLANE